MCVSVTSSSDCLPKPLSMILHGKTRVEEVSTVEDSLQPFKQMTTKTNQAQASLRLLCTVPMWSPSPMHCLDLHDLHDLRNRSTVFVHELLKLLRANGIQATYRLIPSNMDLATISISRSENSKHQVPVDHDLLATAQASDNGKTLLARTKEGPVIIMT